MGHDRPLAGRTTRGTLQSQSAGEGPITATRRTADGGAAREVAGSAAGRVGQRVFSQYRVIPASGSQRSEAGGGGPSTRSAHRDLVLETDLFLTWSGTGGRSGTRSGRCEHPPSSSRRSGTSERSGPAGGGSGARPGAASNRPAAAGGQEPATRSGQRARQQVTTPPVSGQRQPAARSGQRVRHQVRMSPAPGQRQPAARSRLRQVRHQTRSHQQPPSGQEQAAAGPAPDQEPPAAGVASYRPAARSRRR